jgi:predicted HTH transcriptional regulator
LAQEVLLKEIANNKFITIPALSKIMNINVRNTKNNISKLKDREGREAHVEPDKGGYWKVNNE